MQRRRLSIVGSGLDRSYYFWYWDGGETGTSDEQIFVVEHDDLDSALELLALAIPIPVPGETQLDMMRRIMKSGPFASLEGELELAKRLGSLLIPDALAAEIATEWAANGNAPLLVRVLPSSRSAQVAWELLPILMAEADGEVVIRRLVELADIYQEVSFSVHVGRARVPKPWPGSASDPATLYIIDPLTQTREVQVLDDEGHATFRKLIKISGHDKSSVNDEFGRKHLHSALTGYPAPERLIYVGHAVVADTSQGSASLLLSDSDRMFGVTSIFDATNRPLSALDLFEGTSNSPRRVQSIQAAEQIKREDLQWPAVRGSRQSGAELWPMPSRIALVACGSGADMFNPEPTSLPVALVNAGAEYVTASRWSLPTDHAFQELGGVTGHPLVETALALDAAHGLDDPIAAIADWQRDRLAEWTTTGGAIEASPLLWAAFTTYTGPERTIEELVPTATEEQE